MLYVLRHQTHGKAEVAGTFDKYNHKHSLPDSVMQEIKPIYKDLTRPDLLKNANMGKPRM